MDPAQEQTARLLERWHGGERAALDELLARNLPWVEQFVRQRLGPELRGREETVDVVQDAVVDILTYGPKFVVPGRDRFRALLGRLVENNLRDRHAYHHAQRRDAGREEPLPSRAVLRLGETPSQIVARDEHAALMRLALELLPPQDREVLVLREFDELPFDAIAARVGLSESGTRKRYHRALLLLARKTRALRHGEVDEALDD